MHVPQIPESARIRFRCKTHTRWSDEDNQNVLNNAVYMTLLEEARHAYFGKLGLLEINHFPFLLAQTNIRFLSPGRGGVDVEVEVITTRLGRSSIEQSYRVREPQGGRVWCEAEAVMVTFDPARRASAPMSAQFKRAVQEFEGIV